MRALFVVAVALGSALTFCAQPLAGAAALPAYGGAASVWAATSLFFQSALLLGYLLVHLVTRWLGPRRQRWVHVAMLGLAWVAWAEPSAAWTDATGERGPWLELWARLGIPMIAVGGTTPALSRWLVERGDEDPYPLYAASNVGSLGVLLAYPLLLEPVLGRTATWWAWWIGLAALGVLTVACAWSVRGASSEPATRESIPAHWRESPRWILWAALPSGLLVADTVHLTTDLAPVPVLWILPLAAYLLTWILAFSRHGPALGRIAMRVVPVAMAGLAPLVLLEVSRPSLIIVGAHVVTLMVVGLAFHGALSEHRPHPRGLTAYYGWLAFGGVVGAALVTFVFPTIFDRMLDLPALLVLTLLAVRRRRADESDRSPVERRAVMASAVVLLGGAAWVLTISHGPLRPNGSSVSAVLFLPLLAVFVLAPARPRAWSWVLAVLVTVGTVASEDRRAANDRHRSAYAAHRVVDHDGVRWLAHGRTIHGAVSLDAAAVVLPYHHADSPAADVVRDGDRPENGPPARNIAVVGLGVGALARHAQHARMRFVEIDPVVVDIASGSFPFLDECGGRCSITVADGRLAFASPNAALTDERFDAIVLDAFASDAIPTHLVTLEALRAYLDHLTDDGILAIHVTNEHVDLVPVMAAAAAALQLELRVGEWRRGDPTPRLGAAATHAQGKHLAATRFVALARDTASLDRLGTRWRAPDASESDAPDPWTDDRVDLIAALR